MRIVWGLPDSPRALGWPLPGRRRSTSHISNDWDVGYHYHLDIDSGRVIISMYTLHNIYIYTLHIYIYIFIHTYIHHIALHCIALHCMTLHSTPLHYIHYIYIYIDIFICMKSCINIYIYISGSLFIILNVFYKTKQQELFTHGENKQISVDVVSYLIRHSTSTASVTSPASLGCTGDDFWAKGLVIIRISLRGFFMFWESIHQNTAGKTHDPLSKSPYPLVEGSLEAKLPTIWTVKTQSREEAERREKIRRKKR